MLQEVWDFMLHVEHARGQVYLVEWNVRHSYDCEVMESKKNEERPGGIVQ